MLKYIYDYDRKRFHSFIDLVNMYDLPVSDFLIYMSLKACVPNEWKHKLNFETANSLNNKSF